jgi:hypothetical protein
MTLSNGGASASVPAGSLAVGSDLITVSYTPDAGSSSTYNSASGTNSVTVTAALITPTVTLTPAFSSITTAQALTVTIAVNGGSGNPAPTGTVTLTSGSYTSAAMTLAGAPSSAPITIPAGTLPAGSNTLKSTYTPDTASSSTYNGATGTNSVTVTALITPTVTVTPGSSSITASQAMTVTVVVSGGGGNPTPTGSVTLSGGGYTSAATALSGGRASINAPGGSLAVGSDTLTATYTPDAASSSTYLSATGMGTVTVTSGTTYVLTVNSAFPASGISVNVTPPDNNGQGSGTTSFTRTYNANALVTLSAPLSYNTYSLVSWTGCNSNPSISVCDVTMTANTTVTATYNEPGIISITVTPTTAVTIGTQQQFVATVNGNGSFNHGVTWTVSAPSGSSLSPGNISSAGLYNTPFPAPATVTVTATSVSTPTVSGSAAVTLQAASGSGPALTVDVDTPNSPSENPHTINPFIYGMNGYLEDSVSTTIAHPGIVRWGGDDVSRYNYKNTWTNSANDWYFENFQGAGGQPGGGTFNAFIASNNNLGAATLGTVPVLGWVSNGANGCSFQQPAYPEQLGQNGNPAFNSYNGFNCGSGYYPDGTDGCTNSKGCGIYGSDTIAAITSISEPPPDITASSTPAPGSSISAMTTWADGAWSGGWVESLVNTGGIGPASSGTGVSVWDLDNEPTWWSAVHRDVHPDPFTYDEVTNHGIGTALAIKIADPSAQVSGPVIDDWWAYFYSMEDIWDGYDEGPCYEPWGNPQDRAAHGGIPLIEYYLQQFNSYSQKYGVRLLDYVDIHGYFAPDYPAGSGNSVAFTTAGDTQEQEARMNGTRVFWDPTYTDPNYLQPNYYGAPASSANCYPPAQAPQLIPMMQTWVSNDYPGTKTSIDEYNFGGLESINGAVVQADILGIFGRQGLDMGALWPTTNYNQQMPGNYAYGMYRNYDGKDSTFGGTYLYATSTSSGSDAEDQLAVYAAQRSSDQAITVMVINKTYGPLTSTLSLENFTTASTTAQVYLYSNANPNAIVPQTAATVTPPAGSGTTSTIGYTFPAQSITLLVVPN